MTSNEPAVRLTRYDLMQEAFPHIRPLTASVYMREPYSTHKHRRCKLLVLLGALRQHEEFRALGTDAEDAMVEAIERSCMNAAVAWCTEKNVQCSWQISEFVRLYSTVVHERSVDLETEAFGLRVVRGEIDPNVVGSIPTEEIRGSAEAAAAAAARRDIEVVQKIFHGRTCPNCEQDKGHTVDHRQLRGLDEPKTVIGTCQFCGEEWIIEK